MKNENIDKVLEIVNQQLPGNHMVTVNQLDEDLRQYGLDSLNLVKTVVLMENTFDIEISDEELWFSNLNSINKIIAVLKKSGVNVTSDIIRL